MSDLAGTIRAALLTLVLALAACAHLTTVDTQPPAPPGGLRVASVTSRSVTLAWTASADDVGVTGYDVLSGSTGTTVAGTSATATHTVTSLAPSASYTFRVRARDAAGNVSAPSDAVTVNTTSGELSAADFVVWAFSQVNVNEAEDPQVRQLAPDVNIRAFGKWSTYGDEAADYDFAQIGRYHENGVAFIGGGTASIILPQDFATPAIFDDMSTRDASGAPVAHPELYFAEGARRGNLFNPRYRQYLVGWTKIQIDGGVDGLFFDELISGFSGGTAHDWNGNEGFDDYAIADFNQYLLDKYPTYTADDWKSRFGMTDDNVLRRDLPADDLGRNFHYRRYLQANGWTTNPLTPANPLAAEWGDVVDNRMYAADTSFTATYLRRYWQEMIDELRAYAMSTAQRPILITSNGILPDVDFNSVGMYAWNPDERTPDYKGVEYVPVTGGHLNGAKSLQASYRYLKDRSRDVAGDAPVVVFIDWPNETMTNYQNLPLAEKQDYWRIFGAEAYANGIFPAFHLKETLGEPTAEQSGILGFFIAYAQFYKDHRAIFRANDLAPEAVRADVANVSVSLLAQRGTGRRTLHVVNHDYAAAQGMHPRTGFGVEADVAACPTRISMISPDFTGSKTPAFSCSDGRLRATIDRLDYYDVLVLD